MPEGLFRLVFENSGDALLLLNELFVAEQNQAAQKLLGGDGQTLIGRSFFSLLSDVVWNGYTVTTAEEFYSIFIEVQEGKTFEAWCKKPDGRLFFSRIRMWPVASNGNRFTALDVQDISLQKRDKDELVAYRWRMEKLVDEKTEALEISNQELLAAMEELDTSNEELHANNEELFLTNERLAEEIELHKKTMAEKSVLEEKLRQFITQSTNGIIILDEKGLVEEWNNSMIIITGISGEYAIGKTIWHIVGEMSPDGNEDLYNRFENQTRSFFRDVKSGLYRRLSFETQIKSKKSQIKTIEIMLYPIITEGRIYGGVIISDITQRKNDEEALEDYRFELEQLLEKNTERYTQLSERYNEIYERSTNAISFLDVEQDGTRLKFFDMNPVACRIFGVTSEQIEKGLYADEILSPSVYNAFQKNILPALLRGEVVRHTEDENRGNGIWDSSIIPIKDKDGQVRGIASVSTDVTVLYENKKLSAILKSAIESWSHELWISDKYGKPVLQNKVSQQNWGIRIGEGVQQMDIDTTAKNKFLDFEKRALNGEAVQFEHTFNTDKGNRHILYTLQPILIDNKPDGFLGLGLDLTERIAQVKKIAQSEALYRLLADNIADVIFTMDVPSMKIVYVSPSVYKLRGFTPEEAMNQSLNEMMTPESYRIITKEIPERIRAFNQGDTEAITKDYELLLRHKNGSSVWVEIITTIITDETGRLSQMVAVTRNIAKRKKAEEELKEREERYSLITKLSGFIIFDNDLITEKASWDGAVNEVTGYSIDEFNNFTDIDFSEMIHPDDRERVESIRNESLNNIEPFNISFRLLTKQNDYIWVELKSFVLGKDNVPYRSLGIMKDVTHEHEMLELLRKSEKQLRTIFEANKDGIVLLNKDLKIIDLNPAIYNKSSFTKESLIGNDASFFVPDYFKANFTRYIDLIFTGEFVSNFETLLRTNIDSFIPVEISGISIELNDQALALLMVRDISERKKLEKDLLNSVLKTEEQERLVFSQELHDGIGPILSAVKMYVQWLGKPNARLEQSEMIKDLEKLVDESSQAIREMSFRMSPHILQNYGLVEALNAFIEKISKTSAVEILLKVDIDDRFEESTEIVLYRALCECITNSINHGKASLITIAFTEEMNQTVIIFTDDGKGFNVDEVLSKHQGIGMMNIKSRLKTINGQMMIDSTINQGTRITIVISRIQGL